MRFRVPPARAPLARTFGTLLLITLLPLMARPAAPTAAQGQPPLRHLRVERVTTREQRSAIAATGAAIEEVGPDYVTVAATPEEERQIGALGYTPQAITGPLD